MTRVIFDEQAQKFVYAAPHVRRTNCQWCDKPLPSDAGPARRFCNNLCARHAWLATPKGAESRRRVREANYNDNPDKSAARWYVRNALRDGKLTKPTTCSACGEAPRYIEAHHHNGYDEAHRLDVTWLCKKCHFKFHPRTAGRSFR